MHQIAVVSPLSSTPKPGKLQELSGSVSARGQVESPSIQPKTKDCEASTLAEESRWAWKCSERVPKITLTLASEGSKHSLKQVNPMYFCALVIWGC